LKVLDESSTDTAEISALINLAYASGDYKSQFEYSRAAFKLGEGVTSIRHKSRSEIVYGSFLSEIKPDSGISLINSGFRRYLENESYKYAANALYVKGVTFEVISMYDSALNAYENLFQLASDRAIHPEWGDAAYAIAYINNIRGKNLEALKWAFEAKKAYEKSENLKKIGRTLNEIGIIYDQQGLYSDALDNYLKALDFSIENDDIESEVLINNNIGVIYDNMNNSEMALKYYSNGLEKARINNLKIDEASLLNNLSYIHLSRGDTLLGIQLLRKVLQIDLSIDYPYFESYPLEGLGAVFIAQDKLDSATYLLDKALSISKKCEDVIVQATIHKSLGEISQKKGANIAAMQHFTQSLELSKAARLPAEIQEALLSLYEHFRKKGNLKQALSYLEEYQHFSDSINHQNNIEKATQLAAEYEFKKQTNAMELERALAEQTMNEEIEAKSQENKLLILGACTVLLLTFILIRAYALIKKKNERLQHLNEEKNKLIGVVAHDLRNPLNMIKGIIPLLADDKNETRDAYFPKYVEMLGASSEKMTTMIERVLDISAIENMRLNLKMEKTDLNGLTKQSIANFIAIANQKQIEIVDDIKEGEKQYSEVDPNYLEQVLDNLLSNALKFSTQGKKIFVGLRETGTQNVIEIRDQGPGISEAEKVDLFKAFSTASSKPTAQERSTGLGLSIALKFVHAMNGKIEVESKVGEGTTFKVLLPSI